MIFNARLYPYKSGLAFRLRTLNVIFNTMFCSLYYWWRKHQYH